jgi:long-chain acyl-CoA synthetase
VSRTAPHGEEIQALVVNKPGDHSTEDELVGWTQDQLAACRYPRITEFADALPMTSTGKIRKRGLT